MDPIPLTDAELRELVRDAIARARSGLSNPPVAAPSAATAPITTPADDAAVVVHVHASQALFMMGPGGDADGNCLIEPAVRCTHCGYCQTMGH